MFKLDGLSGIRKSKWKNLRPGVVLLSGVTINDSLIPELVNYPVITDQLLKTLYQKYRFLSDREVLIADVVYNYSPFNLSRGLNNGELEIQNINQIRQNYQKEKKMLLVDSGFTDNFDIPIINTNAVDHDYLIQDKYNSFSYLYGLNNNLEQIPSVFHEMDLKLSLNDLFAGRIKQKFNIPDDKEVLLHIAVDFSKSMDSLGKLDIVISAVNSLYKNITSVFKKTRIKIYLFSETCIPAEFPVSKGNLYRGDTSYSSFMKKVLHFRDKDMHNKIILFTDGIPTDRTKALKMGELIKKNNIDYSQIIFDIKDEQRHEIEFPFGKDNCSVVDNVVTEINEKMVKIELDDKALDNKMKKIFYEFSEIANTCGGNQIVLKINRSVNLVSVECYDKYMGLLTLATNKKTEEINGEIYNDGEKKIKKWTFPEL